MEAEHVAKAEAEAKAKAEAEAKAKEEEKLNRRIALGIQIFLGVVGALTLMATSDEERKRIATLAAVMNAVDSLVAFREER